MGPAALHQPNQAAETAHTGEVSGHAVVGRLVNKLDFERLLSVRSKNRSTHFAIHHVVGVPSRSRPAHLMRQEAELSTASHQLTHGLVDNQGQGQGQWLGCVVPKRHARRSVTRSLLKRQMRRVFEQGAAALPPGLWLMRLSQGFPVGQFPSASSTALRAAAQLELLQLLSDAQRRAKTP